MLATIGYERADLEDFVATLTLSGIDILVDIRDRAQSRRPGFSKSSLSKALADAGIGYMHLRELGDPKEGREAARSGDFKRFREIYGQVILSDVAQRALADLEALAVEQSICLMCFERDQQNCHRKIVADSLETTLSVKAKHLGVKQGAGRDAKSRRMRYSDKGATTSLEQVL